ncbi:hypothetical protein FRC17_009466 [Serendipita sp. 399]|nr:hypothetical protein FRC17_009466 [Serendipita sp. 399]
MHNVRSTILTVGVIVAGPLLFDNVEAQSATTTAICAQEFDWMQNTAGQSPCLVAAYLQGACGSGQWTVPLLPIINGQQQAYNPPNNVTRSLCTCAGAVYNLMSACAACQGGGWILFAPWALECNNGGFLTLPDPYPANIPVPSNTTIPKYAAVDPRSWTGGRFNVSEAQAIGSGGIVPSSSSAPPLSSSSTTTSSDSPTPTSAGRRTDNTGAIVGGAVGGLLGVALICVLLVWILCGDSIRNRTQSKGKQLKPDILGRAFSTPNNHGLNQYTGQHLDQQAPSIVAPVPIRPYPLPTGFQSYRSASTAASAKVEEGISSEQNLSSRSPRTSTEGMSLLQRVASSIRWRSHSKTHSATSYGSGTAMTSNVLSRIDAEDEGHGVREISRQNSTRRMVEPTPYIVPPQEVEPRVLDISLEAARGGPQESNHGFLSAAEEKRRLNPPAEVNQSVLPPSAAPWLSSRNVARYTNQGPASTPPNSILSLGSGGATAGSNSQDGHTMAIRDSRAAPTTAVSEPAASDRQTRGHSLPSNIALSSPLELGSQAASSGVLDASPIVPPYYTKNSASAGASASGHQSNLRFMVNNPDRNVEM